MKSSSKTRESSAIFLANYFSRPDIQKLNLLQDYLAWSLKTIEDIQEDPLKSFYVVGILSSLVEIFKIG